MRRIATEHRSGDVDIAGTGGTALSFVQRLPGSNAEFTRCRSFPDKLPVSNPLFTVELVPGGDQFISNHSLQLTGSGLRIWHGTSVDARHLKLGGQNLRKTA